MTMIPFSEVDFKQRQTFLSELLQIDSFET